MSQVRVLIVADHPVVVSGCKALLSADPSIEASEAADGNSGYSAYFAQPPDAALIDINLSDDSGLELCRRILSRDPEARIAIFSMNENLFFAVRAIEAGAKGYIGMHDDPMLFVEAVRRIAQGDFYLRPEVARDIAFNRAIPAALQIAGLNARELEILRLVGAKHSIVEIAEILKISPKTAANNSTILKQKLGARSLAELMRIALDSKLV